MQPSKNFNQQTPSPLRERAGVRVITTTDQTDTASRAMAALPTFPSMCKMNQEIVMVAIHTSEDIIHALREDPQLLSEVRRAILTDEILALPVQFAAMLATQNKILAELTEMRETQTSILAELAETRETQASMLATQNRMLAELAETRETQASMLATQNKILDELAETRETQTSMLATQNKMLAELAETRAAQESMQGDIRALHGMYRQQHEDFGRFRGSYAIDAAKRNSWELARTFAQVHHLRRLNIRRLRGAELSDFLDENYDAIDALQLRERAWETFQAADFIAEVTGRKIDHPGFYIAMEASYTGDLEDVRRATDHAKMLRSSTGKDVYAVVAAVRLAPGVDSRLFSNSERFIERNDQNTAYWFRLTGARMEPLEPY